MPASSSGGPSTAADRKAARESRRNTGQRRLSRNESEKMRRDKLNMHIAELAKLVPTVAAATRKLDKSSILRLSVNYLRMHYELKKAKAFEKWRPSFLTEENLGGMLLEAYDGFLLVVSQKGDILYVSDMVTPLLGHSQVDLLGQSVYQLVHPEDVALCRDQFSVNHPAPDLEAAMGKPSPEPSTVHTVYPVSTNGRRSFHVRMLTLHYKEQKAYELVHLSCHVRTFHPADGQGGTTVIMGVARLASQEAVRQLNVVASDAREFTTQHGLDGNIMYADQRHALYNGRMAHEVYGKSPFTFIPAEDLPTVKFSHYKIMLSGTVDSTVFRLYTKSGGILFVESRSSVCCDNWTKEPKFILSNNVLISEELFWVLMGQQRAEMLEFEEGAKSDVISHRCDATDTDVINGSSEVTDRSVCSGSDGVTEVSNSPEKAVAGRPDTTTDEKSQDTDALNGESTTSTGPGSSCSDSYTSCWDGSETEAADRVESQTEVVKNNTVQDQFDRDVSASEGYGKTGTETNPWSVTSSRVRDASRGSILHSLLYDHEEDSVPPSSRPGPDGCGDLPHPITTTPTDKGDFQQEVSATPLDTADSQRVVSATHLDTADSQQVVSVTHLDTADSQQSDVKTSLIQAQLAQQLAGKYGQLERSLQRQRAELGMLRDNLLRYLLSHPEAQQTYLQRLQLLETKRQQHESALKNLRKLYTEHQKQLPKALPDLQNVSFPGLEANTSSSPSFDAGPQTLDLGPQVIDLGPPLWDASPPPPHTGPAILHTGPPTPHTGPPTLQTGQPTLHSGPPTLQTGQPTLHTGPPTPHTGPPTLHTGQPTLHTGQPTLNTGPPTLHNIPTLLANPPTSDISQPGKNTGPLLKDFDEITFNITQPVLNDQDRQKLHCDSTLEMGYTAWIQEDLFIPTSDSFGHKPSLQTETDKCQQQVRPRQPRLHVSDQQTMKTADDSMALNFLSPQESVNSLWGMLCDIPTDSHTGPIDSANPSWFSS